MSAAPSGQPLIRRGRGPALAVAVLLLLAGCAHGPTTAPGPANLGQFYHQRLGWGGCGPFAVAPEDKAVFADPRFDCAYLRVPLDYSQPGGPVAKLAVLRQKAVVPSARIGALLMNPGGPGASGTSLVPSISQQLGGGPLAQRFDLVGFDPRGVGASQPSVQCYTGPERDADRLDVIVDTSPAGVARIEDKAKDYSRKCAQRSGGDRALANIGTRDAARDIDVLRAALGEAKLTYLGYSYGTDLGTAYAEAFPQNVRALVLDGAVDPNQSQADSLIAQAAGFQHAFDVFGAWCAGQPDCPLGTDPTKTTAAFQRLVLPVIDHPVPLADGRKMSYTDAVTGTIQALYVPELWAPLKRGLQQLAQGQGRILMFLADNYYSRQPNGTYTDLIDAFTAISCMDHRPITDPAQAFEISKRAIAVAPFEDDGHGPSPARDTCAFWPVPPTTVPHVPNVTGLPSVLVVSVTGDPATPYQAGVNLAKDLNARLLTVEGTQHTAALHGNNCVDGIVTRYLTDLALPSDGARCTTAAPR